MAPRSLAWILAVTGQKALWYGAPSPTSFLSESEFNRLILEYYPPAPQPSYAETVARKPGGAVTSQDLRECRELIRSKYALDTSIYNHRDVHRANRHIVDDMARRSAGALDDIHRTVIGWTRAHDQWSPDEWAKVVEIHARIQWLVNRSNRGQGNGQM